MKTKTLILAWTLIGMTCMGGMCSKDGDTGDSGDGYVEPVLKSDATWLYLTSDLPLFYADNTSRPAARKWIATKISAAMAFTSGDDSTKDLLLFHFENNSKDTRFVSEALNPGGTEFMEIVLQKFSKTPEPGVYTMDVDYKEGYCWFEIFKANGDKHDSTRTQDFNTSTLNITKMTVLVTAGGLTQCRMSGTDSIWLKYFPTGASSTTDIHSMQCTFNNVLINYTQ